VSPAHRRVLCGGPRARWTGRQGPFRVFNPGPAGRFLRMALRLQRPHPQPGFASLAPEKMNATITPDLLFEAHSSVLDLVFYDADQFPSEYKGHAFVALKGSWNRSEPTGYKVVRVPFRDGRPEGHYENFVTGFWASGEHRAEVWGRPAALAVAKDGSLLIADDTGGTIWRISYTGPPSEHA